MHEGEWLGFDTSMSFGHKGLGLTRTALHDARDPIGASSTAQRSHGEGVTGSHQELAHAHLRAPR